jgi:hypothetical protein
LLKSFKPSLKALDTGKNHIHFKNSAKIDLSLVTSMIRQVAETPKNLTVSNPF